MVPVFVIFTPYRNIYSALSRMNSKIKERLNLVNSEINERLNLVVNSKINESISKMQLEMKSNMLEMKSEMMSEVKPLICVMTAVAGIGWMQVLDKRG